MVCNLQFQRLPSTVICHLLSWPPFEKNLMLRSSHFFHLYAMIGCIIYLTRVILSTPWPLSFFLSIITGEPCFNSISAIPHGISWTLLAPQTATYLLLLALLVAPCLSLGEVFNLIMSSCPLVHLLSLHLFISLSGKIKVHCPFFQSLVSILNLIVLSYQRWLFV